jgi:hypothetical protein
MKGALVTFPMDPDGLCIHMRLHSGRMYAMFEDNNPLATGHEGLVIEPNTRLYEQILFLFYFL